MNPRKNRKSPKLYETKTLNGPTVAHRIEKPLPISGRITIGKTSGMIPYFEKKECLVSSESPNSPIVMKYKPRKSTKIISVLLKKTGIEPLTEIGDIISGRL